MLNEVWGQWFDLKKKEKNNDHQRLLFFAFFCQKKNKGRRALTAFFGAAAVFQEMKKEIRCVRRLLFRQALLAHTGDETLQLTRG